MLRNLRRTTQNEQGAVLVITALLVPALIVAGALAFGVTTLFTGRQDAQRAVDLGALASATNLPTVSPELPINGTDLFQTLTPGLDPLDWKQRACAVAYDQFADGRSPVANGMRADDTPPDCNVSYLWESPLLATLAACAQDVAELAGCKDGLEQELRSTLPALDTLDASANSAVAAVGGSLPSTDKYLTPELASQLRNACVAQATIGLPGHTSIVCTATLGNLLSAINTQTGALLGPLNPLLAPIIGPLQAAAADGGLDAGTSTGLGFDSSTQVPQLGVDIGALAPALLTPRVHVDVTGLTMKPTFSPLTFDVQTGATARRTFKSALVLPTVGIPGVNAWSSLPPQLQAAFVGKWGARAQGLLERAGVDGRVVDPSVYSQRVSDVADRALSVVSAIDNPVSTRTSHALCGHPLPGGVSCPVGDDVVDSDHLFGPLMQDLHDATRQPPDGDAPSVNDVLSQYADSGETLLVMGVMRPFSLTRLFGTTVWQLLTNQTVNPTIANLLSPLMFEPALDVMQATVVRDGDAFRLEPALATTGLYQARLVK